MIIDDWELIDVKSVKDSDGFWTDYTMWYNADTDEWVCIFGDRELYDPYNSNYDYECDTEEECREWFDNYNGFEDDDDVWASTSVNSSTTNNILSSELIDNLDVVLGELGRNVSKLRKGLWNGALNNKDLAKVETSVNDMNRTVQTYLKLLNL